MSEAEPAAGRETRPALRRREAILRMPSRPASLPSGDRAAYPRHEGPSAYV